MLTDLRNLLYIFQLEEYQPDRFLAWVKKHKPSKNLEKKKKLDWTLKATTLFPLASVFNLLTLGKKPALVLVLASRCLSPFEAMAKTILVFLAKAKLRQRKTLTVIGVTGSFGKTSTKEILAQILETRFKVLKTPQSYNTPLGVAKIILKSLSLKHEVFIVEMGAYKTGEIKTLCRLVKPTIGILTGVTKQHLERFKTLENIIAAKSELIQSLPKEGIAVINFDNEPARKAAQKTTAPVIFYSVSQKPKKEKFVAANQIKLAQDKTQFTLATNLDKKANSLNLKTSLLGKHSVGNILAAITVALELKTEAEDVKKAVQNLAPISHRLEIIKQGETVVIDDGYNANPEGVKAAMEVLQLFKDKPKIVVTPGLIELAGQQFKENLKMGQLIAQTADFVIVVGRTNKKALISGASKHKKVDDNLFWVPNLDEATKKIQELALSPSVILFENDLPDQYE